MSTDGWTIRALRLAVIVWGIVGALWLIGASQ